MRDLKVGSLASLTEVMECAPITCMSAMHRHLPNYTSLAREDESPCSIEWRERERGVQCESGVQLNIHLKFKRLGLRLGIRMRLRTRLERHWIEKWF